MKRSICLLAALFIWTVAPKPTHAQAVQPVITYAGGWNMVGGPAGTNFSAAGGLFAWTGTAYVDVPSRESTNCQGYWAYFFGPRSVTLAAQIATSVTCALQPGWNLVANPFDSVAYLPVGSIAYTWNTSTSTYTVAASLAPGGAAWIYSASAGTATLVTPIVSPTPVPQPTLLISTASPGSIFAVHVGDTIELVTPHSFSYTATWDPAYLQLLQEGDRADLTCAGDPSCEFNFTTRFWFWRAVQAGTTTIAVSPGCVNATPPCGAPARGFQIVISP